MHLIQQATLGTGAFDDVGRPVGVYWNRARTLLAVAGVFTGGQWHGRDIQRGRFLASRASIYEAATLRRVATLDRVRHPINDVAFHPHRPLLAVAAGRYDGGYFYGGELVLWDLTTGTSASILDESREAVTCRFDDDGQALQVTLRPPVDESFYDAERGLTLRPWRGDGSPPEPTRYMWLDATIPAAAWQPPQERSIDLDQLPVTFSRTSGFGDRYTRQPQEAVQQTLAEIARAAGQRYTPRWDVWDLAWTPGNRLLAVRNGTALECWTREGDLIRHLPDPMDGVQVLPAPAGDVTYVNLFGGWVPRATPRTSPVAATRVERIDLRSWERRVVPGLDAPVTLSIAASAHLLARDTDKEWHRRDGPTRDRLITPDLAVSAPLDLGGYDLFNHYLRIDGAPHLYFLQATPPRTDWDRRPRQHAVRDKWICRIDPDSLRIERLFPLEWDPARNGQLVRACGTYVRDEHGEALILACCIQHPRVSRSVEARIVRRRLDDGHTRWTAVFDSQITALVHLPAAGAVVFALTGGQLGVLDARTGALLDLQQVAVAGTASLALVLAGWGNQVAAGLVDGRLVLYECRR